MNVDKRNQALPGPLGRDGFDPVPDFRVQGRWACLPNLEAWHERG